MKTQLMTVLLLSACGISPDVGSQDTDSQTSDLHVEWKLASLDWSYSTEAGFHLSADGAHVILENDDKITVLDANSGAPVIEAQHPGKALVITEDTNGLNVTEKDWDIQGHTTTVTVSNGQSMTFAGELPPDVKMNDTGDIVTINAPSGVTLWHLYAGQTTFFSHIPNSWLLDATHLAVEPDGDGTAHVIPLLNPDAAISFEVKWGSGIKLVGNKIYVLDDQSLTAYDLATGFTVHTTPVLPGLTLLGVNDDKALLGSDAVTMLVWLDKGGVIKTFPEGQSGYWNAAFVPHQNAVIIMQAGEIQKWSAVELCMPGRAPGSCI